MGKFLAIIIVVGAAALFLYQNSYEVPVKFFLGEPRLVSLAAMILVSIFVGFGFSSYLFWKRGTRGKGVNKGEIRGPG